MRLICSGITSLFAVSSVLALENTITFEDQPHDTLLTSQYVSRGIVFSPMLWFGSPSASVPTVKTANHPDVNLPAAFGNVLCPSPPNTQFLTQGVFKAIFVQPGNAGVAATVQSVGADFIDVEWFDTRMEAYDLNGVLIGSVDVPPGPDLGVQYRQINANGIASVIFRLGSLDQTPGATDGVVLDNLTWTVPEPSSILLIGTMITAPLLTRKKRFITI